MDKLFDFILTFLTQIAGGPGPAENNLVRFGLPAIFWAVLLAFAWSRQRQAELSREKLLVWGFGLGLIRELLMFSHMAAQMLNVAEHDAISTVTEPLEHAVALAAVVVIAGSYLRYILDDARLARRYLQIGLAVTATAFLIALPWWSQHIQSNPGSKFHSVWPALLFHVISSTLIASAMFILVSKRGWLRNVVLVALTFFFLGEFLFIINYATGRVNNRILCPIGNSFHIWAIPIFGFVYFHEQSIEKKRAEDALKAYRDHLEELVKERTEALAQLSRQNALILNSAGEGIFGVNLEGTHSFVNPAAARMLGYEPGELIGQPSHSTWHHSRPDGSPFPEQECILHQGYKNGSVQRGNDQVFWRKDGSSFPTRYISTPIYEQGELTGAVVVFQDITIHKQAEAEIARRNSELATQNAISATISQSLDLNTILNAALDRALSALGMEVGCIFLLDPDGETLTLSTCQGTSLPEDLDDLETLWLCQSVSIQAVAELRPVVLNESDIPTDCQTLLIPREELKTMVSTPLVSKNQAMGALTLGARQTSALLPQELDLLTAIGQQIGMAVENARLYQETEHWGEGLALLHEMSIVLSSTLDPGEIYDQITQQSARLLDCPVAYFLRWDQESQEAVGVSSYGVDESQARSLCLRLAEEPILAELVDYRQPMCIEDAQANERVPTCWRDDVKALLGLPVWGANELLGFLFVIEQNRARRWQSDDVDFLESFVSRAAIALENAQLHKQLEWAAALEERQRIAAEMHDGLAQTLSCLGLEADQATELLDDGHARQVLDKLHKMRDTVNRALHDVRLSITSLHASPMPRQPLQDCLASIAGEFAVEGEPGMELVTNIEATLYLPPDQLEQVQRVVREGLLNASRHAQARQITVHLTAEGQDITIIIEDDGKGFDPDAQRSDHFGLSIMRARAARIGGRVEIDSAPGRGTRVIFNWPRDDVSQPQVDQTSKGNNHSGGESPTDSNQQLTSF